MNQENTSSPAIVVKVLDDFTVAINRGSDHGVAKGDKFLVYFVELDELTDPISGENLGHLEVVRGTGTVAHVQPKLATLKSNRTEPGGRIIRRGTGMMAYAMGETIEQPERIAIPFDDAKIGDFAKEI